MNNDEKNDELLARVKADFALAEQVYGRQRQEAEEDLKFVMGEQWDPRIKMERISQGRPVLVFNQLDPHVRQLVNVAKQNKPSINYSPLDTSADKETALVLQSIVKDIESKSKAECVYDKAYENMCITGEGYIKVITDYISDEDFDQHILLKSIDDINSVYIDPNFTSDYNNINWAIHFTKMPISEFEELYPDAQITSGMINDMHDDWYDGNEVRIAEYYYIEREDREIVLLNDGTKMDYKEYKKVEKTIGSEIVKKRKTTVRTVKCVKTNGAEILEEYVFPGKYIPIIPVIARDFTIDGNRYFQGVVRPAKDAQRALNSYKNNQTEMIAMAPRAPYLVVAQQTEGLERFWNQLNTANMPYLPYKQVSDENNNPAPPPQRQQFDPQIATLVQATEAASNDIKAITGMYDPALGSDKREASGKAILTRQKQSELGNFGYIDNLCKSLKYLGTVLLNMIPVIYDTERDVMVKDEGKQDKKFKINSMEEENPIFLGKGVYDCQVLIGPYGENKRTQAIEIMLNLIQADPNVGPLLNDKIVEMMEFEGSKEISERLKVLLPPELRGEMSEEQQAAMAEAEQMKQQYEAQLNALTQLVSNLTGELNEAKAKLANDQAKYNTQMQIAELQATTQLLQQYIKEDALDSREEFKSRLQQGFEQNVNEMPNVSIPKAGDQLVLAGVNDPVTKDNKAQVDQEAALQNELKNINSNAPKMRV